MIRVNIDKLRMFTSKAGLYSWDESGEKVIVAFSSLSLEEVLGENAEIRIIGSKEGSDLVVEKVILSRGSVREDVDPKTLEGWFKYIEQSEVSKK